MRRPITLAVLVAGSYALLQCSRFDTSSDAADASSEIPDANVPEGSAPESSAATRDAGPDVVEPPATNLLTNGDFENGCADWNLGAGMTATPSGDSHSGATACLVCFEDPNPKHDNVLVQSLSQLLPAGTVTKGSLWMKLPGTDGGDAGDAGSAIHMESRTFGFAGGPAIAAAFSGQKTVLSKWVEVRFPDMLVPEGGITEVQARVYSVEQNGACFLIDDALLYVAK
jgi:hypothetical protein